MYRNTGSWYRQIPVKFVIYRPQFHDFVVELVIYRPSNREISVEFFIYRVAYLNIHVKLVIYRRFFCKFPCKYDEIAAEYRGKSIKFRPTEVICGGIGFKLAFAKVQCRPSLIM